MNSANGSQIWGGSTRQHSTEHSLNGVFSTVAIYVGIGFYLSPRFNSGAEIQHLLAMPVMTLTLLGISIIQFPVAIFLRRHLYFGKDLDDAKERFAGYQTMPLVSWAFADGLAIYGLINAFLKTPLSR